MPFGILDTGYLDFPSNIDAAYVEGMRTRAGVEFPRVLTEIDSRLSAFNSTIDPLLATLLAPATDAIYSEDFRPVAFKFEKASPFTLPRPQTTEGQAVALPLFVFDAGTEFTEDSLETSSLGKIIQNVESLILGLKALRRHQTLSRLFSMEEIRVDEKTSMKTPGFAGSGTGSNAFLGPYPSGDSLPNGYTHYYRCASADRAATIKQGLARLQMWYPNGNFEMVGSQAAIDAVSALGDFVDASSPLIRQGSGEAEAMVDPLTYCGVYYKVIKVRKPLLDVPDDYMCIYVTFGNNNPQNPLAWRFDPMHGRNAYIRSRQLYPLAESLVVYRFGIGVNNRVAAVLIKVDVSGDYTSPVINYIA